MYIILVINCFCDLTVSSVKQKILFLYSAAISIIVISLTLTSESENLDFYVNLWYMYKKTELNIC